MKQKKVQSLSRKLFVNFILSCLLPIVVVSFLVSYLFGTYQYQEIRSRAENNTKLISAYMTKYHYNIYIYSKMLILRCFSLSIF